MSSVNKDAKTLYYRYFVYSQEEEAMRIKLFGENVEFGTVVVHGTPKKYTSIVADPSNIKSDAIVVTKGDIRKIKYTSPSK